MRVCRLASVLSWMVLPVLPAIAATPPATVVTETAAIAPPSAPATVVNATQRLSTGAGVASIRWFDVYLGQLGVERIEVARSIGKGFRDMPAFATGKGGRLEFDARGPSIAGIAAGELSLVGGFTFRTSARTYDLRDLRMLVRPGAEPRIDFVDAKGRSYIYGDKLMYEVVDQGRSFRIRSMDLNMGEAMAQGLGVPELAGATIGEMHLLAGIVDAPAFAWAKVAGDPNWPGEPANGGADTYRADVFMSSFTGSVQECRNCDGPGGALDGDVKMTPSSTLRNNVNLGSATATVAGDPLGTSTALHAADVPWYEKFTSSPNDPDFSYPYMFNDQHPYLIWNLYRLDANGQITQIGRSGVKHAFLTTNSGQCDTSNGNHVLGWSCSDTYGTGNNNSPSDLGPRRELVPAKGQFGRCGSIFDVACDGIEDSVDQGVFRDRMLVKESDLQSCRAAPNGDARCWMESWYIVRDDINIYNTMATRGVVPSYTSVWSLTNMFSGVDNYRLGSAVDKWAALVDAAVVSRVVELQAPEGKAKVAVRVRDLGNGTWRYDYALMNYDFAREATTGIESNHTLRVLRNDGFNRFTVSIDDPTAAISQVAYADGDVDRTDWTATVSNSAVEWVAPAVAASQNWGVMARFSFVADKAPVQGTVNLGVTEPGTPANYGVGAFRVGQVPIGPGDNILRDGFEDPVAP
jgi:hypothetical protein